MGYVKSLRMVVCLVCNRRIVEHQAVRAGAGRNGSVSVWLCRACARDPEVAVQKRRALS
jgi:hypothetical protein